MLEQLIPLFAIGVGIAFAFVQMYFITNMMRRAFSPRWSEAERMVRILKKEFGVKARVHSIDAVGIIRLLVLTEPFTAPLQEIQRAFGRDIRTEEHKKSATASPLPMLAVLPSSGKPHKAKTSPERANATPALQPMPTR